MQQTTMFTAAPPSAPAKAKAAPTPDELFARFLAEHLEVCERALDLARRKLAAGGKRLGVAALWEEMRGKVGVALNNSCRAPLARWLVAREPKLAELIEMRVRATERAPKRRRRVA